MNCRKFTKGDPVRPDHDMEQVQKAWEAVNSLSAIELADRLSVTPGRIRQIALSLGLSRKGRDWRFSGPDIEKIAGHTRMREIMTTTHPHWRKKDEG